MRASVELRRAKAQKKQALKEDFGGAFGAALCGLAIGIIFAIGG